MDQYSNIDKLLENQYPTHFWISLYRGFGVRLGIGGLGVEAWVNSSVGWRGVGCRVLNTPYRKTLLII